MFVLYQRAPHRFCISPPSSRTSLSRKFTSDLRYLFTMFVLYHFCLSAPSSHTHTLLSLSLSLPLTRLDYSC
ncbi:hypothetical protein MPTK1_5g11670 [Marchantia polymorpha subsp. ruderalis]|uniref:Uncharacterized protein n=2 Tax=Marchantia polymorpha TaxID=3197 RepID=A0AAF6BHC9_MARPO|nr:hypothetical protein MARPO_0093s0089 [Marchantia polymorpha]BBN11413.1 hypothetical protein Mp_5g11670 [Marchantia polymorpha subsp. ruderalis]|eukprot:PTQ33025.1 hypothetical protein MARPO_0093s0089 [Marchantia polymorpha]